MLEIRRLVLLRELAIRGTIAAVADALNFTPSAVSQQLSQLEKETGTQLLRKAGHTDIADAMDRDVLRQNPLPGMWSFQMVDAFDDGFYTRTKGLHQRALDELMNGQRHVFEAEMKELRRTRGREGHEPTPEHAYGEAERQA